VLPITPNALADKGVDNDINWLDANDLHMHPRFKTERGVADAVIAGNGFSNGTGVGVDIVTYPFLRGGGRSQRGNAPTSVTSRSAVARQAGAAGAGTTESFPSAAVRLAPQTDGMTAVALALSGDAGVAARQLAGAETCILESYMYPRTLHVSQNLTCIPEPYMYPRTLHPTLHTMNY
jgi:hypothetical protein